MEHDETIQHLLQGYVAFDLLDFNFDNLGTREN